MTGFSRSPARLSSIAPLPHRAANVVAAKLSSSPTPQDAERLLWTIKAFDAVARTIG